MGSMGREIGTIRTLEPGRRQSFGVLRLGVTGHRRIDHPEAVDVRVGDVLDDLSARDLDGEVELWSSLAEGADRIAASLAVERGHVLRVVLPLRVEDYETDFPDSVEEFRSLLGAAAAVVIAAPERTREDAYRAAGIEIIEASDVLIAVWDGLPARGRGGTAEIVHEARARGLPLIWIDAGDPEAAITHERMGDLPAP
jgi:hypothetical protein